jgi:protein N-terminal amidase
VFCGYPEVSVDEKESKHYYNSQMVVSPSGEFVKSYKKHFLYDTDKSWAEEGPSFDTMELYLPRKPDQVIRVGHGICMDINPWEFKADFEKFEFGCYHRDQKCSLIIFSSAWLDPNSYPTDKKATDDTINYWANRLLPIIKDSTNTKPCYFVCSNRVGSELGENYMGSSVILKVRPNVGIVKNLSKKQQGFMMETLFV